MSQVGSGAPRDRYLFLSLESLHNFAGGRAVSQCGRSGHRVQYSNLTSNWLGISVDRACGTNLKAYAEENLFLPIGVEAGEWGTDTK